jgi:predicted permease
MEFTKIIGNQVFIMFLLISVGFILYKIKLISDATNKQLTGIVLSVVIPALIIDTYQMDYDATQANNMLLGFLLSFLSILTAIVLSYVLKFKSRKESLSTERFSVIFTNCGFMGIPLMSALFGSLGVFYCNTYLTMFNVIIWTYGIILMNHKKKETSKRSLKEQLKPFITPTMICIVLGLVMYFLKIKLPTPVAKTTKYVASMNTPLAMIVSGVCIAQSNLLSAIKKLRVYYVAFLKCFVVPLLIMAIFLLFPLDNTLLTTILIAGACPTAATTMLFANKYGGDVEMASNVFTITTIMSIISLPIVILIAQTFIFV